MTRKHSHCQNLSHDDDTTGVRGRTHWFNCIVLVRRSSYFLSAFSVAFFAGRRALLITSCIVHAIAVCLWSLRSCSSTGQNAQEPRLVVGKRLVVHLLFMEVHAYHAVQQKSEITTTNDKVFNKSVGKPLESRQSYYQTNSIDKSHAQVVLFPSHSVFIH